MGTFIDKYSMMFGGLDQFSTDELEEIAKVATDVMSYQATGNTSGVVNSIKDIFSKMDIDSFEYMDKTLDGTLFLEFGDEIEKEAGALTLFQPKPTGLAGLAHTFKEAYTKEMGPKAGPVKRALGFMTLAGIAAGLLPLAMEAGRSIKEKFLHVGVPEQILNLFPRLRTDLTPDELKRQYLAIKKFAPSVATDPYLTGQLLMNVMEGGGGAILPNVISQQAQQMQEKLQSKTQKLPVAPLASALTSVGTKGLFGK